MTLLLWIVRIIVLLILIRMVLRLLFPRGIPARRTTGAGKLERSGGTLVRDPHCGTYVPQQGALSIGTGASAVYFCSAACRDAYAQSLRRGA